jgi:RNA polymerase sigma factor (sigma-70 family)
MQVIRTFQDAELLANLCSPEKNEEAIKAIYREHFHSLRWFVMNNGGTLQDAEDVFQDVLVNFIDLVQKNKFRGESSVKTLLFSMNRFTWLNELKRRGRSAQRELKYEKAQDNEVADVSGMMVEKEMKTAVMKLVESLGETCKKILVMFYYENLSMKEILHNLEYENEQVVRNKKYKCLKQLEQMIAGNPALKQTLKNLFHG